MNFLKKNKKAFIILFVDIIFIMSFIMFNINILNNRRNIIYFKFAVVSMPVGFAIGLIFALILEFYKYRGESDKAERFNNTVNSIFSKLDIIFFSTSIFSVYATVILALMFIFPTNSTKIFNIGDEWFLSILYICWVITLLMLVYLTSFIFKFNYFVHSKIFPGVHGEKLTVNIVVIARIIAYSLSIVIYMLNNFIKFGVKFNLPTYLAVHEIAGETILTFIMIDSLIQIVLNCITNRFKKEFARTISLIKYNVQLVVYFIVLIIDTNVYIAFSIYLFVCNLIYYKGGVSPMGIVTILILNIPLYILWDKMFTKKVNSKTRIIWWFVRQLRTLGQYTRITDRKCSSIRLYKGFLNAINDFVEERITYFGKPIPEIRIKTHEQILKHLFRAYNIDKNTIEKLLNKDKQVQVAIVNYNDKVIIIKCKYKGIRVLLEEAILKKSPFKYLNRNLEKLQVHYYKLTLKIDENCISIK